MAVTVYFGSGDDSFHGRNFRETVFDDPMLEFPYTSLTRKNVFVSFPLVGGFERIKQIVVDETDRVTQVSLAVDCLIANKHLH